MRQTDLFAPTLRRPPAEAEAQNAIWLARGGYIRTQGQDFALLPLAESLRARLQTRWDEALHPHAAQPLHHASAAALAASDLRSWRQLPRVFRQYIRLDGETRLAAGLLGSRAVPALRVDILQAQPEASRAETVLADLLAAHTWPAMQSAQTPQGRGGFFLHPLGTETLFTCPACGYAAESRAARRAPDFPPEEAAQPLETVHTPGCHTIAELCDFLDIPPSRTAKAVFMTARIGGKSRLVFAIVRGDMTLNEDKLRRVLGAESLRSATHEEIRALGAEPGYASPVGIRDALVVVDEHIPHSPNLVAGANQRDMHLRHVNYGRDFQAARVADLVQAAEGDPCPQCGAALESQPAFRLYDLHVPAALTAQYSDRDGKPQSIWHSSLTIYSGALLGALAETFHDDNGLTLPPELAPFDVHLIWLASRQMDTRAAAERLYAELQAAGFRVLYDDRAERPGVKFKDADLLGIPVRITIGERALQEDAVELKYRRADMRQNVPLKDIITTLQKGQP